MRAATFTTYINAQTDPGLEQAFNRQSQLAVSSYATIERAAEKATRATAGLLGARGTQGAQQGTQAIQQRTVAIQRSAAAAAEAERASVRMVTATRREGQAAAAAARDHQQLARGLTTTSVALNVVSGRLDPVSSRVSTLARAVTDLTGVQLGLAAFGATLFAIGRSANTYANLEARVRPFFKTQRDVNSAMEDIIGIAQRSRSALEPVVDVYTRLTTVGQSIGLSRRRISEVTEIATKAAAVGGGTAQARDAALLQFGQALSGDFKAAGQEINSLKEQAPVLFQAILKGFKNADGTIGTTLGKFKAMAEAGELSTARVLDAVQRSSAYINEMANRVPNTLSRASTDFTNALTVNIGRFDQAVGFTSTLADGISVAARNMRVLIALAAGAVTTFAAIKITGLVTEAVAAARSTAIMAAAVQQLGVRRKANAEASLAQHQREVAALNAEQAEIRQNIALLERQRAVAARDVQRYQPGPGYAGSSRLAARASEEERAAVRGLAAERQRLNIIQGASVAATGRVTAAQGVLDVATKNVQARTGLFRSALGGLVNFLGGPFGVAFAVATTAVYLLATAQSASAKAADQMRDSQATLASYIDRTTGKIVEQNSQLVRNRVLQTEDRKETAKQGLVDAATALRKAGSDAEAGFGIGGKQLTANLQAAIGRFTATGNRGDLTAVQGEIDKIRGRSKTVARQLDDALTGFVQSARPVSQAAAELRLLRGKPRDANDVARAYGEAPTPPPTLAAPGTVRTRAQIDAAARRQAASTEVQRARGDLAVLNAQRDSKTGLLPGRDAVQTQNELAAALQRVTAAQDAQKASTRAATEQRQQARQAARDAIQDAKDELAAKTDASLAALERRKPELGEAAFRLERVRILQSYDDELTKIDSSSAASHRASQQRIADARAEVEAAAKAGEKRSDILSGYDDVPRALDRAADQTEDLSKFIDTAVDGLAFVGKTRAEIEEIKKINPLGTGIYTDEMFAADSRKINEGVRKPLRDMEREFARGEEIARLQLQGRDSEAAALQRKYQLLDGGIDLSEAEYRGLIRNEQQQLRINDVLASRQRVVSTITGALDSARDTAENFLVNVGKDPANAFKSALTEFQANFTRINSRALVEKLFAGSDEKLRALLQGKSSVDTAIDKFGKSVDALDDTSSRSERAVDRVATAFENAAARIETASGVIPTTGGAPVTGADLNGNVSGTVPGLSGGALAAVVTAGVAAAKGAVPAGIEEPAEIGGEVTVTARRRAKPAPAIPLPRSVTPDARAVYNNIGGSLFGKAAGALDRVIDKVKGVKGGTVTGNGLDSDVKLTTGSQFFKKIGDSFGSALQGAGQGAIASGFAKALGIKQSQTGAQIGGAIGGLTGIPGAGFVGGLIGGTVGGLFKKTKQASTTLTFDAGTGEVGASDAVGRGSTAKAAATQLGGGLVSGLQSIAEALGGTLAGSGSVSIGYRPGHKDGAYRVDTSGQGKLTGVLAFDNEEDAIRAAINDALQDGVIAGISAASKKILASGQDLQRALAKATAIESIPKRLLQLTDPVRYAVTELNTEFTKLISYLKEGGATAEQFADAQKLYDLERADALKQATSQAADQIDQFLKDMVGGSSSPLNKRTTYENAAGDLAAFKADIAAGKIVDQSALLSAARNFQDASRSLNGSSSSFFDDFEMLRGLLSKARDNAGTTDISTLPASPFANDNAVQTAIASLQRSQQVVTQTQTDVIAAKLDTLIGVVGDLDVGNGGGGGYNRSAIGLLPGFAQA